DRGLHHRSLRLTTADPRTRDDPSPPLRGTSPDIGRKEQKMNEQYNHIVKSLDDEQRALQGELIRMGLMAAAQLEAALDVVERRDDGAAERVIANDEAIDTLEQQVNH